MIDSALNTADVLSENNIGILQELFFSGIVIEGHTVLFNRIYIGSYFCSKFFLKQNGWKTILRICKTEKVGVTLVIPVFSQKDLAAGKKIIKETLEHYNDVIDEITVNDWGMLALCRREYNDKQLNIGRLLLKDPRDIRVKSYNISEPIPLSIQMNTDLECSAYFELDQITTKMRLEGYAKTCRFALHIPYCYITTGNICKFASIQREMSEKFRPNADCEMTCRNIAEKYLGNDEMYRIGRTVFFKQKNNTDLGLIHRLIYFPIDEYLELSHQ